MKRATGIGGIFFIPKASAEYRQHPGDSQAEEAEFGKVGWVMDPEGNRIELWDPPEH